MTGCLINLVEPILEGLNSAWIIPIQKNNTSEHYLGNPSKEETKVINLGVLDVHIDQR